MKSNENNRENYHINSITHLRIDTLDTKLIHELRAIKHDVPIEGTVVWDKDNGFNSIINSTKILSEYIDMEDLSKIILYDIVLPQTLLFENYKILFFIEPGTITQEAYGGRYNMQEKICSSDSQANGPPFIAREGTYLVCY